MRQSEEAVAKFRQEHNLTVSSEGKVAVSSSSSPNSMANSSQPAARQPRSVPSTSSADGEGRRRKPSAIPDVVRSTVISDLRKQEAEVAARKQTPPRAIPMAHPTIVNARAEKRDIETFDRRRGRAHHHQSEERL